LNELLNTKENVTEEQIPYMITRKIGSMTYKVDTVLQRGSDSPRSVALSRPLHFGRIRGHAPAGLYP
jgi:hypothetical protein